LGCAGFAGWILEIEMGFDLLHEPFIHAVRLDGHTVRLRILDTPRQTGG
jgi:hypothetical protein